MTHVVNTITNGVTTFANYPYNSFARFQGKYLGAGDTGLFLLDDPASTEVVDGTLTTGELSFGSEFQKRVSDFFLAMRSEGDITLNVIVDEQVAASYTISTRGINALKQRRSLVGKGLKGKYWTFELTCSDQFDYDTMNIGAVALSRRL